MKRPLGKTEDLYFTKGRPFKIVQIADIQDGPHVSPNTIKFLYEICKREKPDLAVFTGDQIKGYSPELAGKNSDFKCKKIIDTITAPFVNNGVKFAFCFGNHDDQAFGADKELQFKYYSENKGCINVRGDIGIDGVCNNYINIKSSDGKKTVFNLYLIDSLSATFSGYASAVSKGQIDWYKRVRDYLKEENGNYIPSIVFQHIPVYEIWNVLKEVPKDHKPHAVGYKEHNGKFFTLDEKYLLRGNNDFVLETPASPSNDVNQGEFSACAEKGDVIAMYFGHDHANSFTSKYKGVNLGYTQNCGFNVYGNGLHRGVRIIEIDESKPYEYATRTIEWQDYFSKNDIEEKHKYLYYKYAPNSMDKLLLNIKRLSIVTGVALAAVSVAVILKKRKDR